MRILDMAQQHRWGNVFSQEETTQETVFLKTSKKVQYGTR